ncbi:hypothetical protein NS2_57940 [Nocardia seriolae NBRC 15557]|nr:hypothetical protein NSER024013_21750 [Nocardia seriolae]GEM27555.1 hypothetical protein NS2_57940 [Nocardia seriolae NBRC 15557]
MQELQEPRVQARQFGVAVAVRIGLEVDVGLFAADARVDVHEQVVDEPGGQHVQPPGDLAQADAGVGEHEIHGRTEPGHLVHGPAEVADDVLLPEPLAAQGGGELTLGGAHQVADGGGGGGVQAQRHHIGDHAAGAAQGGGGAPGHRQAQHDLARAGHGPNEGGEGGHHDGGRAGGQIARHRIQQGCGRFRQRATEQAGVRVHRAGAPAQLRRFGQARQVFAPVVAVGLELVRIPVCRIGFHDALERFGLAGRDLVPAHGGVVDLGGALQHGERADPIEEDVVEARVPVPAVGCQAQHGDLAEAVAGQVQGRGVLGAHPRLGRGLRVGGAAQVDGVDAVVERGVDELPRQVVDFDDAQVAGAELAPGAARRVGEQLHVDRAGELDVLRDGEGRVPGQLLGEPDAALGRGEHERRRRVCGSRGGIGGGCDRIGGGRSRIRGGSGQVAAGSHSETSCGL